jgi:hypothetical protein
MDRASITASVGPAAGTIPMKNIVLTLAVLLTAISASCAFAQSAPVRGVGLLALNASDARGNAGNAAGSRTMQIEVPDSGGGGHVGTRALRGGGDSGSGHDDGASAPASGSTPVAAPIAPGDPTTPTAPKRTNYRWQALVPGAIK